jgi:hypothetical protein
MENRMALVDKVDDILYKPAVGRRLTMKKAHSMKAASRANIGTQRHRAFRLKSSQIEINERIAALQKELTELMDAGPNALVAGEAVEAAVQGVRRSLSQGEHANESSVLYCVVDELGRLIERKVGEKFSTEDAFRVARMRGETAKLEILKQAGPILSLNQAADALHVTRQTVHKRIQNESLFGMKYQEEIRIPAWQIRDGEVVGGIGVVLKSLRTTDWGKMLFLHLDNMQLGGRKPKDLILEGNAEKVAELAAVFGEQGAR